MIARIALLLSLLCAAPAMAQTATLCPWFTTGSAAEALGGDVSLTTNVAGTFDGMCVFTRGSGVSAPTLQIKVGNANTHPCPAVSAKLSALGNEAVQCETMMSNGRRADMIAGRVRDVYFVVTMADVPAATRAPAPDARPTDPYAAPLLERVAEQVAGNLY